MTWLALDTATATASVAVGTGADDSEAEQLLGARQHARGLIPMVDRLLARRGIGLDALSGVIVADGPGSFTGLRVGASFVKGLADTRPMTLHTAPSLLVRAMAVAQDGLTVLAVTDALRGDAYAAAYQFAGAGLRIVTPPGVFGAEQVLELIARADRVVGELTPPQLGAAGGRFAGSEPPCARFLLELLHRAGATTPITDVHSWEPTYGRPAEAQAKWEREHGRALPHPAGAPG